MNEQIINEILSAMGCALQPGAAVSPFRAEEDGREYNVWRLTTNRGEAVLKRVEQQEKDVYTAFFPEGGGPVPQVYGWTEHDGGQYMLMEYIDGQTMSRSSPQKLTATLDSLIALQECLWQDTARAGVGYGFERSWPNRLRRLEFMGDLAEAYQAYLDEFRTVPRTLCNDDMLPFNVIVAGSRAVIIDWEYAGILPYPCALARLIAFGEDDPDAMFTMTQAERRFAVDYYYDHLICRKGISRPEYLRTLRLFIFKEYSEWVYCANSSGEKSEYYEKYYALAREMATGKDGDIF